MRATILALALDAIADPSIESHIENATYPAIDSTAFESLDGSAIYAGDAAERVEYETQQVYVSDNMIATEPETELREVACEWIADLEAGWLGVNRSDGDWLFETIGAMKGTMFHRATIDVDEFAAYLSDYPDADAWNVTQSRSLDADDDAKESIIAYHDAAHLADTGGSRKTSMLGFRYRPNGRYTRGVVSESGYVAVFDGPDTPSAYAEFINSQILPFATLPEEFQVLLGDVRDADQGAVEADGVSDE